MLLLLISWLHFLASALIEHPLFGMAWFRIPYSSQGLLYPIIISRVQSWHWSYQSSNNSPIKCLIPWGHHVPVYSPDSPALLRIRSRFLSRPCMSGSSTSMFGQMPQTFECKSVPYPGIEPTLAVNALPLELYTLK